MSTLENSELLEITDSNLKPTSFNQELNVIPLIDDNFSYSNFFDTFLIRNQPCIIKNVTQDWPCTKKWIKHNSLDTNYFRIHYANNKVPISNCKVREYNVQKKSFMNLFDYLDYWERYKKDTKIMDCLYLKDWHFMKEFPNEEIYKVPPYFASDWLNEYYCNNPQLDDDYRFVYVGPKGSWTPFHADVYTSYSWSVNISGRKKWILIPPGKEDYFKDDLGNLLYDIDFSKIKEKNESPIIEIIQEEGQGIFVPSGWHHQVWNLEDTISINHNWINGCNIHFVWDSLKTNLSNVMKEISDCRDMENWMSQCQIVLLTSFGMDYKFFYNFLIEIAKVRMDAMKLGKNLSVSNGWSFGQNHMTFDLKQIMGILKLIEKDENFVEICETEINSNYDLKFLDELETFLI